MNNLDIQYQELLKDILDNGIEKSDRTGTGIKSVFGKQIRHDMSKGFPLLTTKKMAIKSIMTELKWFLQGRTDIQYLRDNGCKIWDGDYEKSGRTDGELGPIYGKQWRDVNGIDQLENLIVGLINNPDGRRHIVNSWNVEELNKMVLPPCHYSFQCYVNDGKLSLMWQQRSVDVFLGLPFNISSYGLLLSLIADEVNMVPDQLVGSLGDTHIYNNHIEQVKEQLRNEPYELPTIHLRDVEVLNGEFKCRLNNYISHPSIKAPLSN